MATISAHRANSGAEIDALIVIVKQLVTLCNELKADHNALVAKLDADAGVTDANYVSTCATAAANADTIAIVY